MPQPPRDPRFTGRDAAFIAGFVVATAALALFDPRAALLGFGVLLMAIGVMR